MFSRREYAIAGSAFGIFATLSLATADAQTVAGLTADATAGGVASQAQAPPPEEKAVQDGLFPKSIQIPGTNVSLSIGGYVKLDFIQDFGPIQDAYEFKTSSIPADGSAAAAHSGRTTLHARESRINLDLRSSAAGLPFRAFVEGDFFGSGNAFRMRHAFGEFGRLLAGQTWTTFMDISARPLTLDFEGPDGEVFVRQPMIRWTQPLTPRWTASIAAENPTPQFAIPAGTAGVAQSNVPDIPGYVRYQHARGHVQAAGILRQLRLDGGVGEENSSSIGWGTNFAFAVKTVGQDELQGQFMIGAGIGRYIEALNGQNLDASVGAAGEVGALLTQAGLIGYTHHWRPGLRSGLSYSTASVDDQSGLSTAVIDRTQDLRANLIYGPSPLVDIGGEVLWGNRSNQDGSDGDSVRLQFVVIYRFN